MKKNLLSRLLVTLFLLTTLFNTTVSQNLQEIEISASYNNVPLEDFLKDLNEKYGIKIFYKKQWTDAYTLSKEFNSTPLLQALNNVFFEHDLKYEIFQDDAIVVFKRISDTRSRYDEGGQVLIVGNPMNIGRFKTALLKGKVLDGKNGDPLVGAVIYINSLEKGATTNNEGEFEMELPTGNHQLQFSYVGFQNSIINIQLIESGSGEFRIFEETHNIDEVTVLGEETDLPRSQMSVVKMTSADLKRLPALLGEVDVLKAMAMKAGVQTVGELSSGFNVRGGNTDQNLILVNGSPVFNSSHLFGFLSLINPDVVEDVRLFKGGMPVRFGERVSSVMEVDFKEGNNETIRINGGIGIINSRLALEGPLGKNKKLTFIAGGRSSYSNWILKKLPDLDLTRSVTNFYDISGKVTYKFDQHNKISLMGYISDDEFSTSSQSVTKYGNVLGNLKLNTKFAEKLFGELELSFSEYNYRLTDFANGKAHEAYHLDNLLTYGSAAYNFKWHPTARHNVDLGFKMVLNEISPGEISPFEQLSVIVPQKLNMEKTREWAGYVGDEFEIFPHFSIVGGIRYSWFENYGTSKVFLYDENQPMAIENIVDSLLFEENEVSASYKGLEPRLGINYDLNINTSLKLNYQRVRQHVFQLSNNAVISPAETWKAADYHLKPLISDQIALGVENDSWFKDFDFSAEIYYKLLQNLIEYKNGARLIMNRNVETVLIPTTGFSYGIEFTAKKTIGRLTGTGSYVYSRTKRKNESEFNEENFWNGKYYPSIYDKPHDLALNATYNLSRRWRVSGNFVFISGRPVTLPETKYQFGGEILIYYSDRNKYRMPPYHRFDFSITFDENLRKKRMWKGSWTLAIYNLYGRNNPYSIYYKKSAPVKENNYRRYSLFKLAVIGIPVPSLTYNFKF